MGVKYQIVVCISSRLDEPLSFARGLLKGTVQIWVLNDNLWGGAALLGNPDGLLSLMGSQDNYRRQPE